MRGDAAPVQQSRFGQREGAGANARHAAPDIGMFEELDQPGRRRIAQRIGDAEHHQGVEPLRFADRLARHRHAHRGTHAARVHRVLLHRVIRPLQHRVGEFEDRLRAQREHLESVRQQVAYPMHALLTMAIKVVEIVAYFFCGCIKSLAAPW